MTHSIDFHCEERPSESPFVERVWRSEGVHATPFISMAQARWSLVIGNVEGRTLVSIHGPETTATPMVAPGNAEFLGIMFRFGTTMPQFSLEKFQNMRDALLPNASRHSFWLASSTWQRPDFENADDFVRRLVHAGVVVWDEVVGDVLNGHTSELSLRSVQRRFKQVTGLTYGKYTQINRARYATTLLKSGMPILDTSYLAGYYDQPHFIRSLKRYVGLTPHQIIRPNREVPLSFLYNTDVDHPAILSE